MNEFSDQTNFPMPHGKKREFRIRREEKNLQIVNCYFKHLHDIFGAIQFILQTELEKSSFK